MPRLPLFMVYYVLLLSNTEGMTAAKGNLSPLAHQQKMQPSPLAPRG
jgi:hypothetical protein